MTRDFAAEMTAIIDAEIGDAPYVSATVALHIVEKLRATDPTLLAGWLDAQAVSVLRDAISTRSRSSKSHARAVRGRSVFADAAQDHAAGDAAALVGFLDVRYVVDDANTRTRLADMRKPELLFAADDYRRQAAENLLEEAFLRALARKVGTRRVSDVFDEDKLATVWGSISGRAAA
jgi:hypothetical protein